MRSGRPWRSKSACSRVITGFHAVDSSGAEPIDKTDFTRLRHFSTPGPTRTFLDGIRVTGGSPVWHSGGIDPEHRITVRDLLELVERCAHRHGKVTPARRRDPNILAQNGRAPFRCDGYEMDSPAAALPDHSVAVRRFDILHPVRTRAQHRHQIALAVHRGDDNGLARTRPDLRPRTSRTAMMRGGSPSPEYQPCTRFTKCPRRVGLQLR